MLAAAGSTPARPAIEQARSTPWLMAMRVNGERVGDIIERTPRFRFEGEGRLSERRIVPETQAARDVLAGAEGPRVERALRGLLGTFDAQSGVTNLESIGFSVDGRSAAVNHVLGNLSWPGIDAEDSFLPPLGPDATARDRNRLRGTMEAMAAELDEAHELGANWGVSYRSITVAQATTDAFFGALRAADRGATVERLDEVTHVLVHELAHRLTEPPITTTDPDDAAAWSRLQLLSEGSADLITSMPGMKRDARERMGLATVPEEPFPSGYEMFVETLGTLLRHAGLDTQDPSHRANIIELLERPDLEDVPESLAAMIVQRNGIEWSRYDEVVDAIEHIGNHGVIPEDAESTEAVQQQLAERTERAGDLIEQLAREARIRRERAGS